MPSRLAASPEAAPQLFRVAMSISRPVVRVEPSELEFSAIRSQGSGGQNVNKVSSAIHLRFDIPSSSLPEDIKARLLSLRDSRITHEGVFILKAQRFRSQDMNRADAVARLQELVDSVSVPPRIRRPTQPSRAERQRRLEKKGRRAELKSLRRPVQD